MDKPIVVGTLPACDPSVAHLFEKEGQSALRNRQLYNQLAEAYNAMRPGNVMILSLAARSNVIGNLANILANRGLVRGVDFEAAPRTKGPDGKLLPKEDRTVALKRLSQAVLSLV